MTMLSFDPRSFHSESSDPFGCRATERAHMATVSSPRWSPPAGVPVGVPRTQFYYWTRNWQEGEREALDALARGEFRRFENGDDAVRWLLSDDDE